MRDDAYQRALVRLLSVPSSPRLGLERMRALLAGLDDPQRAFEVLHVAGTNGKGSVVAYSDALLARQGARRARTTSPHLSSATERIVIEGEPISRERFVALEETVFQAARVMSDPPTFFERMIAMAFRAFAEAGVDIAVVEVGLGGRLDATNVVSPRACAITSIGVDHTMFLGDDLASIAREKGGILKAGVPAVSAPQEPAAASALVAVAGEVGAPLRFVDEDEVLSMRSVPLGFGHGATTQQNAAVAVALLNAAGIELSRDEVRRGLADATWPGRFERVCAEPLVILDGAHNAPAMRALTDVIAADEALRRPVHIVLGMTRGHDAASLGRELSRLAPASLRLVKARAPRSRPADDLAAELSAVGIQAEIAGEVARGLDGALSAARRDGGFVLVTGSLYLVGEARARFLDVEEDPILPEF